MTVEKVPDDKDTGIIVDSISLTLGGNHILKDVSLKVEKGAIVGLQGRNGSGKTMLMKCICGFVRPQKGRIFVSGQEIFKDTDFPRETGIIIETPGFIPYYSGYRNLKILAGISDRVSREKIEETMRTVGLDPSLKRHIKTYSLGMRQRLGIAQAIMEDPSVLILDEPFNGLDEDGVTAMRDVLLGMRDKGTSILIASHNADDLKILCSEVRHMHGGVLD
ncbi:MAG: ATP-binding cassette domain-containing protein [Lachnospiraceae bacterium]|nr:ATP-binding cassette domain-containing protein [Lachnospiraceae bacterium]MEE3461325.1 ATP-binding cassette domain-containing protein [Lachnospiraceae bacterium]